MLRVLHTADWHLGHQLHALSRDHEHAAFLEWLLDTIERLGIDALVVAGDVFDTANPSARAQATWYRFLASAVRRFPQLDVVVIGGNHDSAARLDAPRPVLDALGVRIIGGLPHQAGHIDLDKLVVPLHDAQGRVAAWMAAVPYLRVADLPRVDGDPLVDGVREVYRQAIDAARGRRAPDQALLTTGHCYMTGARTSELSERRILGGNQHALPVDIFPDDVAYAFLGHLHLAQKVGRDSVRYAGSPIPLSMTEAHYPHQVRVVTLDGAQLTGSQAESIPQSVEILRVPDDAPAPPQAALAALQALPTLDDQPRHTLPYLEVRVALDAPEPALRRQVEAAIADKAVRLVKISATLSGDQRALADALPVQSLHDLQPQEVFQRRYTQLFGGTAPDPLLASFHELVELANHPDKP